VNISQLIASYGYWAEFGIIGAESMGVALPGETALVVAATYAGHTHRLSPWLVFLAASAGAIIGDNIGFWLGEKGGYPLARRYGSKVGLNERKLKTARYLFDSHGIKVVVLGRFVSILRTYTAFLAGVSLMKWRRFLLANALGGILWTAVYTLAAYMAGAALLRVSGIIAPFLVGAVILAVILLMPIVRRHAERLAQKAEAAYPGPLA